MRFLETVEGVLKGRKQIFADIHDKRQMKRYFVDFQIAIFLFTFIYGSTMGMYSWGIQIFFSALKVPILLFITLYVCVPTFYVVDSILSGSISLRQILTILLAGFTIMSTILLAFLPVNLFFLLTTTDYTFIVLLNVAIFSLAGLGALIYFLQGYFTFYRIKDQPGPLTDKEGKCRECGKPIKSSQQFCPSCGTRLLSGVDKGFRVSSLPILIGCAVLIFVGTQLAWILRPYFHFYPWFIRPLGGNFYTAILQLLLSLLT